MVPPGFRMMTGPTLLLLSLLGLCHVATAGTRIEPLVSSTEFRVRRRNQNQEGRELYTDDLFLTFSEDGKSKTLDTFILVMFETPSTLQLDALPVLSMAMNKFLLTEFNQIYEEQGDPLDSVSTEVLWDQSTTKNSGSRSLQSAKIGREAEMEVTLTFQAEPSPARIDLEEQIREIMADLSNFVGNLTSFKHSDWEDVTEAYRLETSTEAPVGSPAASIEGPTGGNGQMNSNALVGDNRIATILPTTLVAATLFSLFIFLLVQRRRRATTDASTKGGTTMFAGVENDAYSVDRSLESGNYPFAMTSPAETPKYAMTSQDGSIAFSVSADESNTENPILCGLDYRSGRAIITSMTNASAATARAGNNGDLQNHKKTRASPGGSSCTYPQMESYDEVDSPNGDDRNNRTTNSTRPTVSVSSNDETQRRTTSPSREESREGGHALQGDANTPNKSKPSASYTRYDTKNPGVTTSSHDVLADLEMLESKRAPSRDTSPSAVERSQPSGSLYANFFSCNPKMTTGMSKTYDSRNDRERLFTRNSSFNSCSPSIPSNYNTPVTRHGNAAVKTADSGTSSVGVMAGKAPHIVYNVDGRPVALDDSALPPSTSKPPMPSGSKSAPSSPEKHRYRTTLFRSLPAWRSDSNAYDDNLSPSSPSGNMERSLKDFKNTGYGGRYYPFRRTTVQTPGSQQDDGSARYQSSSMYSENSRRHAGNTPGSDGSAMYQTGAMDSSSARRHAGNTGADGTAMYQNDAMTDTKSGRRHVENTNMDGTAMYQENAMNPMEWSYNPTDNYSIGESTLSDQDGEGMPRQFLFGGRLTRSGKSSKSNDGDEPDTPVSQHTNDSSQVSASRNLISDLVWLEKQIADVRQGSMGDPPAINNVDSLSYVSDPRRLSGTSTKDGSDSRTEKNESVMSSIVCRDCFAPPGKLHIVIHSTKDGPAVHTVKPGSSLEGHIFPGDLIISVDNVDTRSYSAEQVMKMMASKSNRERKITVLHFDEED